MSGKPVAEFDFTEPVLRGLLERQHADLADLPLVRVDSGWDNEVWRLGDRLAVRLPRREAAARLARNEQRWLPVLAPTLPLAVPAPVRLGEPDASYPWCWSIVEWFEGRCADLAPPQGASVDRFVEFLRALHVPAPADAPANPLRGVPLAERHDALWRRVERLEADRAVVLPGLLSVWERGLAARPGRQRVWLHGDLHAQNILTRRGRIEAILDWGDLCAADAAVDLASIWSVYQDPLDRERALQRYAPDQPMLERAMSWAVYFALVLIDSGRQNSPRHERQGLVLRSRLLADV